jgi:hypothetical protein
MRRAYDSEFVMNDSGQFVGIMLGADFCAEHECGIERIKSDFGLKDEDKVWGIEKRRVHILPEGFELVERKDKKKYYALLYNPSSVWMKKLYPNKDFFPSELSLYGDETLACAWDERSFGILTTKKYKNYLDELMKAFQNKDVAIGLGGGHAFKNAGLSIMIISRLPQDYLESLYEKDKDYYELQKTAEKTKIKKVLEKAGKRYYALSPKWADENKKSVKFWLNPIEQHVYNAGWYTVDELKLWAKNKGPVIKSQ